MLRLITEKLVSWREDAYRKPLLIRGVRQVGKSYLVEQFARKYYPNEYVKFDFEARPELKELFAENLEPSHIVPRLETFANKTIKDHQSLVFFDEIQACPQAIIALRYFYEQRPNLHIIAAGSLIEFALQKISIPVGRINLLNIYPLTFSEFLLASKKEKLYEIINDSPKKLPTPEHKLILGEYVKYLAIGGLPEAVKRYIETESILQVLQVQRELVRLYEADFAKYVGKASIECLRQVLHATPTFITKNLKYSQLTQDFTVPTIKNSVELLVLSQIIKKIPDTNPHGLPLGSSASEKFFKILLADLGLLHGLSNMSADIPLNYMSILDSYRGALAEQAVGQSLCQQLDGDLYSWSRTNPGSQAAVDFVVSKTEMLIPIEVKSGLPGRLKSLHLFLKEYPLAKKGFVLSIGEYEEISKSKLVYLPIYYVDGLYENL